MSDMSVDVGRLVCKIGDNGSVYDRDGWIDVSEDGMTGRTYVSVGKLVEANQRIAELEAELFEERQTNHSKSEQLEFMKDKQQRLVELVGEVVKVNERLEAAIRKLEALKEKDDE